MGKENTISKADAEMINLRNDNRKLKNLLDEKDAELATKNNRIALLEKIVKCISKQALHRLRALQGYFHGDDESANSLVDDTIEEIEQALQKGGE